MNRITFGNVKDKVARVLGVCSDDSLVAEMVYSAQERLAHRGKFVGTMAKYTLCSNSAGCLVWPRQFEAIEAFAVCDCPGVIRSSFFEFQANAFGLIDASSCPGNILVDRPRTPTFDAIAGIDKKVRVVADVTEDAEARILIQGYDEDWNWIRTQDDGEWIDGEYVSISTAGAISTNLFSSVTGVIKPITNGTVRLYEYLPLAASSRIIGIYEPDEERPDYRSSLIPGLSNGTTSSGSDCTGRSVTVLAKLRPMPVSHDNDWLLLGNSEAIKLMVMAIQKEERNLLDEAMVYEAKAVDLLEQELSSFQGDGVVPTIRVQSDWIGDGVYNAI